MLRWLSIPLLLLLPFVVRSLWQVFQLVNLDAVAICANTVPSTWQTLWVPIQVLTLIWVSYMVVDVWRSVKLDVAQNSTQ
jgi:hypothetical protein